jgi:hypothetical protein
MLSQRTNHADEGTAVDSKPAINFIRLQEELDECINKVYITALNYLGSMTTYVNDELPASQRNYEKAKAVAQPSFPLSMFLIMLVTLSLGFSFFPYLIITLVGTVSITALAGYFENRAKKAYEELSRRGPSRPDWNYNLDAGKVDRIFQFLEKEKPPAQQDYKETLLQLISCKTLMKDKIDALEVTASGGDVTKLKWVGAKKLAEKITPEEFAKLPPGMREYVKAAENFLDRQVEPLPDPALDSVPETLSSTATTMVQLPSLGNKTSTSSLLTQADSSEKEQKPSAKSKVVLATLAREQARRRGQAQNASRMAKQQPGVSTDSVSRMTAGTFS